MVLVASDKIESYFRDLEKKADDCYDLVSKARKAGFDPALEAEIPRAKDLAERGFKVPNLKALEQQIQERDHLDSTREISPLMQAEDSIELITDGLNIADVIEEIVNLFRIKIPEEVWPSY